MDLIKIGNFLAQLRKEKGMTQESLGDVLHVTNKTISRWETGTYLPPVEMLQKLSELYDISINEILSGNRLEQNDYKEKAEENLKTVIADRTFTLEDKIAFYKTKWRKDHLALSFSCILFVIVLLIAGSLISKYLYIVAGILTFGSYILLYNCMMIYVEKNAFDGHGKF